MQTSPILIGHRGACAYLPEHSKESAVLAFMLGADYIEQDLVATKDNHLVVLHDIYLDTVTNVAEVFADRARSDNHFYAIDFTLQELRTLSLTERKTSTGENVFPNRYTGSAHFSITTFSDQVELVSELNRRFNKNVGLYPEIKSPEFHLSEGKNIAKLFSEELKQLGLNTTTSKVFAQSFEPNSLKSLKHDFGVVVPLIQLIGENSWEESSANYEDMLTQDGLAHIASYAQGIGPWLEQVYNYSENEMTDLVSMAHKEGLKVHPYTHREDVDDLPDTPQAMYNKLKAAGIDGLFTDHLMPYMLG